MAATATIGILGAAADPQSAALRGELEARGARVLMVESQGLNRGQTWSQTEEGLSVDGQSLDGAAAWFLRYLMAPLPPSFERDETYQLFDDWYVSYMQRRERAACQLSWLLELGRRGVPVVNPPQHTSAVQLKPFQLQAARAVGLCLPTTLISNDPWQVRAFCEGLAEVVYKPSLGGGPCRLLDAEARRRLGEITAAPVTFQERVRGTPVRATLLGERLISAASVASEAIDYREDPRYLAGEAALEEIELPAPLIEQLGSLLRECGLLFAGVDLIRRDDGTWVFLEANPAPVYLEVEDRLGHPVTQALAAYLLQIAGAPGEFHTRVAQAARARSFVAYALPFDPDHLVGG